MKAKNTIHPVHPEFKDTFSASAFPLPGIFCSVPGAVFFGFEITETESHYHLLLYEPGANGLDWHIAHRNLVLEKPRACSFYLPADADADDVAVTQQNQDVQITVGKRYR